MDSGSGQVTLISVASTVGTTVAVETTAEGPR